jgi:outer membrane immunogenic protein
MRRLTLAILAASGIALSATAASAADLGRAPVYKAPPAPAPVAYNWTGLYIGGHLGYGWGTDGFSDPTVGTGDIDVDGFLAGAQLGYNWQVGSWVFGLEGDWSWSNGDGSVAGPLGSTFTADRNWYATATARVGYAWENWLWYVKGGAAWADTDYSLVIPGVIAASGGDTRSGWTVGAGVEWALAGNWSAKVEYNYLDFSDESIAGASFDSQNHLVKVGLNYRFGPY